MALFVALALLGLVVGLAAALAWQQGARIPPRTLTYGVEDALEYVAVRLGDPATGPRVRRSDVRRMLEWAVEFAQQPKVRPDPTRPAVLASVEMAQYVQDRAMAAGHAYDAEAIFAVLDLQAEYLASIGAIAAPVMDDAAADDEAPPTT